MNKLLNNFFVNNEKNRINWVSSKLLELNSGETLLDAGAGEMQYKKYYNHLFYTSQDFNQYDGVGDGVGLQTKKWERKTDITSDIINIPVDNESYDNILCTEVLEHLPNPSLALKEFSRILKKGGKLILTAPFCSLTHFAPYHYSTGFNEYWYKYHLKENGFEIIELSKNGNFFNYLEQENLRIPFVIKKYTNTNFIIYYMEIFLSFIQILLLNICEKR